MDFDLQWLLLGLPIAFALGWMASRFDLQQWRRDQRDSPKAYFKGLNLLLNEQHDKAIDAFIEAVQQDPDTSDLHFALGNLFRRRGEYERSVRVHEHLLNRADLPAAERDRAQHGLAQDFMKAGLLDRAEDAWRKLEGTAFDTEARLALLTLHERSRDWRGAIDDATRLQRSGTGSYASRIAQYWCEIAEEAHAKGLSSDVDDALRRAREADPQAARPLVMIGRRARETGDHAAALAAFRTLLTAKPLSFSLVARDYADSAAQTGDDARALEELHMQHERSPSVELLHALARLDPNPASRRQRTATLLARHPTLSVARELLQLRREQGAADDELERIEQAVARAAKPLQRYRCAACGFEAEHYFWHCPGCLSWDSYLPQHLEDQ